MDRDQRSRRQKSGAAHSSNQKRRRDLRSRVGLSKETPRPSSGPARQRRAQPNPRRTAPQNPQKPGYRQGAPHPKRRVTQAEQLRIRRRRAILGALGVLAVLAVGMVLSVNLLFKVTDFKVENLDRTTPANTGIYTEQQIIDALGIQVGENLFGFSTAEKTQALTLALPYLETVEVGIQMPGTVVIKVEPAVERFMMEYNGQWLVLSPSRKVLQITDTQPSGLIWLEAALAPRRTPPPGMEIHLADYNSLDQLTEELEPTPDPEVQSTPTPETAQSSADDALDRIVQNLDSYGLLDGTTLISMQDLSELNFLYQGRISVVLGTDNNLDYKIRMAAYALLDQDGKGLSAGDRGTLDVSYQFQDGEIRAYFYPASEATPPPEPVAEPTPEPAADSSAGTLRPTRKPPGTIPPPKAMPPTPRSPKLIPPRRSRHNKIG